MFYSRSFSDQLSRITAIPAQFSKIVFTADYLPQEANCNYIKSESYVKHQIRQDQNLFSAPHLFSASIFRASRLAVGRPQRIPGSHRSADRPEPPPGLACCRSGFYLLAKFYVNKKSISHYRRMSSTQDAGLTARFFQLIDR